MRIEETVALHEKVGIDLGLTHVAVTSDGARCEKSRFYRGIEQRSNILRRAELPTSVRGNELPFLKALPSRASALAWQGLARKDVA